ncbi:GerAB/ArcD/ProY family transporter [Melghirimyces algeriensis]|uniref:Spore germination protein (Amino acid permease) n=1 Tax=Melghirimyces algeriensis TaxID=910412 RepID=A0A521AW97_9BACL|nr:GerAB/ArcD/ProY family transporter [Melghirimyces algeriensis]SMO39108.1 spore germination protein (amino acid permease) [Melghirimyces algeriensis]
MNSHTNRITQGQFLFIIFHTQIGVGILSLPYNVQETAKGDGWISVLIGGVAVQLLILMHWALNRRFPSQTLFDFLPHLTGRWIAKILTLGYSLFYIMIMITVYVLYFRIIHHWMLQNTPLWVINGLMTLTAVYLVTGTLRHIGRLYVFVSGLSALLVIIATLAYMEPGLNINVNYILPVAQIAGPLNLLKGANETLFSLTGFELALVIYPFVEGSHTGKLKAISLANLIVTMIYTFMTITTLLVFSPVEIRLIPSPVIYMLKAFKFQLVERPDLLFITLWIVSVFTSVVADLFAGTIGVTRLFNLKSHKKVVPWIALGTYLASFIPEDPLDVELVNQIISIAEYIFAIGIPFILLLISHLFHKKEHKPVTQSR